MKKTSQGSWRRTGPLAFGKASVGGLNSKKHKAKKPFHKWRFDTRSYQSGCLCETCKFTIILASSGFRFAEPTAGTEDSWIVCHRRIQY